MNLERIKARRTKALRRWVAAREAPAATWWVLAWNLALRLARVDREHPILPQEEAFRE